jgi:hypothetical protein
MVTFQITVSAVAVHRPSVAGLDALFDVGASPLPTPGLGPSPARWQAQQRRERAPKTKGNPAVT